MEENGFARFHGNLDPTAQEFWPSYPLGPLPPPPPLFSLLPPPPPVFYPYGPPSPAYENPPSPAPVLPPATLPPTRALLLSSVPGDASESTIRRDLESFGDVRAVQMGRVREGIVAVHFYDLRAAHAALEHIRIQHMQHQHRLRIYFSQFAGAPPPLPPPAKGLVSGRVVWAQFVVPAFNAFPDGHNQGTLVVFNLDSHISASALAQIFSSFGPIREMRDTPTKRHQKFVEFYDVRDAAAALVELNGKEIGGKQVTIEFSRPGGFGRRNFALPSKKFPPPPASSMRSIPLRTSPNNVPPRCHSGSSQQIQQPPLIYSSKKSFRNVESSIGDRKAGEEKCGAAGEGNTSGATVITKTKASQREAKNSSRPWKGGKNRSLDSRFLIKEDAVVDPDCKDTRTTVMIKNIPNKYSQKLLLNMLDNHCIHYNEQKKKPLSSYDFVYLPIDFNNKCNVGYGFVNMTSPEAALRLHKSFHQQHWEVFNSRKICEVTYARVQGLEALKEHFKNSKFACETEEYLPVVFSPPRDGRASLSDPLPIVPSLCHSDDSTTRSATTVSVLSSSPSLSSDAACDVGGPPSTYSAATSSSGGEDYHDDYDVGGQ
ncbi:hypothetical protein V2J09_013160 [Rumex salicifolius]